MKTQIAFLSVLLASLTLIGCASSLERAEKQLARGDANGAMVTYGEILRDEPGQREAIVGLRRARLKWIDQSLIQVRMLRLGKNYGESEALLEDIIAKQDQWQLFPTGVVYATQKEELGFLSVRALETIKKALDEKQPFRAAFLLSKNQSILETTLKKDTRGLRSQIKAEGRRYCQNFAQGLSAREYYTQEWLQHVCKIWEVHLPHLTTKNSVKLFGEVEPAIKVEGFTPEYSKILSENFRKSFKASIWFDEKSNQKFPLYIEGGFSSDVEKAMEHKSQHYTIQEAYTETTVRKKEPGDDPEGIFALIEFIAWLAGSDPSEEVEDNYNGTVTVHTKKYREVGREYIYEAMAHRQLMGLDLNVWSTLRGEKMSFGYKDEFDFTTYEHSVSFPQAGIHPSQPKYMKETEWLTLNGQRLFDRLSQSLSEAWRDRFCVEEKLKDNLPAREKVMRCSHGLESDSAAFVDLWFQKQLGVGRQEVLAMIPNETIAAPAP